MLKEILQQFIDADAFSIHPFGKGHINHTYLCEGVGEKYILQKINQYVFKQPTEVIENMVLVGTHLAQKKEYTLKNILPIPAKSGKYYTIIDNDYWRLLPFIEHTITYPKADTPIQAFEAAKGYGKFVKALFDFPIEQLHMTIPNFHNSVLRMKRFEPAVHQADTERKRQAVSEIEYIREQAPIFDLIDRLSLPLRVTHNDTKIDNVLMHIETHQAVCVIDLDTVMPGSLLSDFGDMVRTFTNAEEEDADDIQRVFLRKDIFEALCEGFLGELADSMSELEKQHLLDGAKWIILEQALRFLTDFLEGDIYYKIAYSNHNLVRAKNQIALYQSLLEQETTLMSYLNRILQTN